MRFRLRTLLIILAFLPPLLAIGWWCYDFSRSGGWQQNEIERKRAAALEEDARLREEMNRYRRADPVRP
jgi:hypothetical protein